MSIIKCEITGGRTWCLARRRTELARISHTPREKCARRAEVEALCASLRGRPEATFRLLRPAPMPSQVIGRPVLISQPDLGCEINRLVRMRVKQGNRSDPQQHQRQLQHGGRRRHVTPVPGNEIGQRDIYETRGRYRHHIR